MAAACNLTFCVVGRDARQLAAARALQNSGYTVLGAEGAGQADYILLRSEWWHFNAMTRAEARERYRAVE